MYFSVDRVHIFVDFVY